jgi:hypothetical protein
MEDTVKVGMVGVDMVKVDTEDMVEVNMEEVVKVGIVKVDMVKVEAMVKVEMAGVDIVKAGTEGIEGDGRHALARAMRSE